MKMMNTARHSFEANENNNRIKNEPNHLFNSEFNGSHLLKKRTHTEIVN